MEIGKSSKPEVPKPQTDKLMPEQYTTLQNAAPTNVAKQLDEIMRRLRQLEEKYSGVRKKSQFVEQSMLKDAKDLFEEIHALSETITEQKLQMSELTEKLTKLDEEIKGSVDKSELNAIAKYVDFWQPLNFVTRKEVEKRIAENSKTVIK